MPLKVIRFFREVSLWLYITRSVSSATLFLDRILFLITSSALADERANLVSKRPWILEKSSPFTWVMESISSWEVTITHALPWQAVPKSSTTVCRFNISSVFSPIYWPISSTKNTTWWSFPLDKIYCLTLRANSSILMEYVPVTALSHRVLADSGL